ncbi:T9SS type A sorting domain-containing protein [bacterium]|nr:T9SS type A sorting domain-containing protein [bacterium]
MKHNILTIAVLILIAASFNTNLYARVINVPDDFDAIQDAIGESEDGDTILVQPGEYVENLDFDGKAITVASLILTTGNEAYIDSTIINGDENGSVVIFSRGEDESSILMGFTLTNGAAENGGGIYSENSGPSLINLLIKENTASNAGGGVYGTSSTMSLLNVSLIENYSQNNGGGLAVLNNSAITYTYGSVMENYGGAGSGLFCRWSSMDASYLLIKHNGSGTQVSAWEIFDWDGEHVEFRNLTIIGDGQVGMGMDCEYADILMRNLIVQGHQHDNVHSGASNLTYSCVEGEPDRNNCIDEDPLFVDPDNDDYSLQPDSPCIDAGDPDSPRDIDGSRADMGYYQLKGGVLEGYVLDLVDDAPLEGAVVRSNSGVMAISDVEGFFNIRMNTVGAFDLIASLEGYNDGIISDQQVDANDTLEVTFRLTHPEFHIAEERMDVVLEPGDSTTVDVTIGNTGNGPMQWQARKRYPNVEVWGLRQSFMVSDETEDARIEGIVFADSCFYVSGANISDAGDSTNSIHVLDIEGNLVHNFEQIGDSRYGMKDLAFDGELIWGTDDDYAIGFNTAGDSITSFEVPDGSMNALTWDNNLEMLWVARTTGRGIYACDTEGNVIVTLPRYDFRIKGLAYWSDDPDSCNLYILHCPDNESQILHKMNTETGDTMFVAMLEPEQGGQPGGAYITNMYDSRSWVFMSIVNNADDDRIDIWQIEGNMSWLTIEPIAGEIEADSTQNINLVIRTEDLELDVWEGEIVFTYDAAGGETILPVSLTIEEPSSADPNKEAVPNVFAVTKVYPNPFNSTVTITYLLRISTVVEFELFDLTGREIKTLVNEQKKSGVHTTTLNAGELPTGMYFMQMKAANQVFTQKVMLIR